MQDELTALQLELLKTEERINKVECENKTLVDRWVQKMNEEAQKMNMENEKIQPKLGVKEERPQEREDFEELLELSLPKKAIQACKFPTSNRRITGQHKGEISSLAVSPDGTTFATGSINDNSIILHDFLNGSVKMQLQGSLQGISCLDYSQCEDWIVGGSNDQIARVWGISSGRIKVKI